MRLRHVAVPFQILWGVAAAICAAAAIAAFAEHLNVSGAVAAVLAILFVAAAVWRWRVLPRGHDAHAAYRELELAIQAAPHGRLQAGDVELIAQATQLMPSLTRWESSDQHGPDDRIVITETYWLLWLPPLVLRDIAAESVFEGGHDATAAKSGGRHLNDELSMRQMLRYLWHVLRTGQGFLAAAEMRALAIELHTASPLPKA